MADANECHDLEGLPAAYAAWRASRLGQITDALEQKLVLDLVGLPAGLRVLDVGCGDGILAVELSRRGAQAAGVDASRQMIGAALQRVERLGCDTSFQVARVETLPFEDNCFDVVLAITVLCFVEEAAVALREMTRVLKPGGRLILGELGRHSIWAAVRRIKGWLGSAVWGRARFRGAKELKQLANEAGLIDISVHGAIFYPPLGIAARLLEPIDRRIGAYALTGAAFLALVATKPRDASDEDACPSKQATQS